MATVWSLPPQRSEEAPHRTNPRRRSWWLAIISIAIAVISAGYILRDWKDAPPVEQSASAPTNEGAPKPEIALDPEIFGKARGVDVTSPAEEPGHEESKGAAVELIIPLVTCLVSTVTALSTLLLNWRADVREQREANFKLAQLAMSLETNEQAGHRPGPVPRDRAPPKEACQVNNKHRTPLSRIANLAKSRLHTRSR